LLRERTVTDMSVAGERIAVTVWGERISPLLDVAQRALLLTTREGQVIERAEVTLLRGGGGTKLAAIRDLRADTALCGAVSRGLAQHAAALGLRLVPFLAGEVAEVVAAYLAGQLPREELTMPGWHAGKQVGGAGRWNP
jgi:predicted Fe-Mo cluster-binding NifX family protein